MSAYNKEQEQEPDSTKCPAHGCFMYPSMYVDGGPWACRYHAKQPVDSWQKITAILHTHKRLLDIVNHADGIEPHEFDLLRDKNAFELEDMLKPAMKGEGYPAETFKAWKCRVKEFVYAAIAKEISKIETSGKSVLDREISNAVNAFTNGTLRKQQRMRSFSHMDED